MLGKQLKQFRIDAGLTQKELAIKAGVTQQCISKYEKCGANYDYHIVLAIMNALDLEYEIRKKAVLNVDYKDSRSVCRR
jgi:transcriptional regulator with XRE-family HTH domain